MPSHVLDTRLIICPFMLTSSKSLGFRNIQPRALYLLHASAVQWQTTRILSFFHLHTVSSPASVWVWV